MLLAILKMHVARSCYNSFLVSNLAWCWNAKLDLGCNWGLPRNHCEDSVAQQAILGRTRFVQYGLRPRLTPSFVLRCNPPILEHRHGIQHVQWLLGSPNGAR